MKQRQRVHLGSMGKKCDTARRRGDAGQKRGGEMEETAPVGLT
jgi:hypothetical protein